jgi:DNA-directed RNA polymerase III subunit RPC11
MDTGNNRLECRTCPYQHAITTPIYSRREFERKEKEDVFGGPGAWDNAQKGRAQCPKDGCDGDEAAFFQVQIRSADEPMTSFYKVSSLLRALYGAIEAAGVMAGFSETNPLSSAWPAGIAGERTR